MIWIVEEARDEHRAAVEWLNRKTGVDTHFYLVTVKIVRIDNSLPAYQFIPVVVPNQSRKCGQYFCAFTEELEKRGFRFKRSSNFRDTTPYRFFNCIDGSSQWWYRHEFENGRAYAGISSNAKKSIATQHIEALDKRKSTINKKLQLEWDGDWCNSVGISCKGSFDDSEAGLAEIRAWAVENIIKLSEAIPPEMLEEISAEVPEE